jgi:outer membrane murein-binding lipoprotein Lpp
MSKTGKRPLAASASVAIALMCGGCVTNTDFNQLQSRVVQLEGTNQQLDEQVTILRKRTKTAEARVARLSAAQLEAAAVPRPAPVPSPAPAPSPAAGDNQDEAIIAASHQVSELAKDVDQLSKDISQYQAEVEQSIHEITQSLEQIR